MSQFSLNFFSLTIFGLIIIIETLLCLTIMAADRKWLLEPRMLLEQKATVAKMKERRTHNNKVKCEKEGISYAFIFERKQNLPAVVRTQMTTDERNIQCVDYEDEEDSEMEHRLSTFYKKTNKWAKIHETMRRDENELEKTEMTSQRMRDQLFFEGREARIAFYSYIGYKERQKTLEIKAYCTGHRSNPVPVYDDVQRRLDACKQLGNVYWGVESKIGDFRFYYTFKYERKTGQNGTECNDHEDKTDKELEEHLSFYYYNGRDEQLAILLRSYHNEKKLLEDHKKNFAKVNSLDDLGALLRAYDNSHNGLAEEEQYEQVIKQHQMFGFLHPISEETLATQKVMCDAAKNELDAYMKKMKEQLEQRK